MNLTNGIRNTLRGFIAGETEDYEHLSPDFGMHEGRTREEWISHEIQEFKDRRELMGYYGIGREPYVSIDAVGKRGDVTFSMKSPQGAFIYQDTWNLGPDGLFVGNGRKFEIVSKLQFQEGKKPRRGLAIRSHNGSITAVTPIGLEVEECDLKAGINGHRDGFASVSILLPNDDLIGREAKFRIMDDAGNRSTETVWMRGIEEAQFEDGLFPEVSGPEVTIPMTEHPIWSLTIVDEAGDRAYFGHPEPGTYYFKNPVKSAFITDAMDNDWKVEV